MVAVLCTQGVDGQPCQKPFCLTCCNVLPVADESVNLLEAISPVDENDRFLDAFDDDTGAAIMSGDDADNEEL